MFYLTTHSTYFIYGYMVSDIWLRTILIVRKETRCRHIGYSFRLTARVLLYAPSHRQDSTYHSVCYTSHGALAGTRNSSVGSPYEGSIRRPIAPWANTLTTELHLAPSCRIIQIFSSWQENKRRRRGRGRRGREGGGGGGGGFLLLHSYFKWTHPVWKLPDQEIVWLYWFDCVCLFVDRLKG